MPRARHPTVAVHSEADARALHVRFADEAVCIGPAAARKSYLNIPAIISAAEITGADAIHPGYGFLSENAEFARDLREVRHHVHRPDARGDARLGRQGHARAQNAERYGLPLLPGSGVLDERRARRRARPSASASRSSSRRRGGGGGRGMRIVRGDGEMPRRVRERDAARPRPASRTPTSTCEKFVEQPRHIEFQVLADQHGGVWTLGERECSLQRRHQKVIEEAPSPAMTAEKRAGDGRGHPHAPSARRATRRSARSSS